MSSESCHEDHLSGWVLAVALRLLSPLVAVLPRDVRDVLGCAARSSCATVIVTLPPGPLGCAADTAITSTAPCSPARSMGCKWLCFPVRTQFVLLLHFLTSLAHFFHL